ncbi:kinesin-like protein KIFC2 isoform X2 [Tachyglossus aculeatus]|uniref:kinesin-like protein KIFC2 isoform X2 n=1 Tax=Tachyglossus aculeatus TaxID=9261 RepID=UPI0018F527C7|nr:kinesin-like protein KIFC2 isoform X2 [Tachyglossus aculeatus]
MYAFYSLLIYIFYSLFRRERSGEGAVDHSQGSDPREHHQPLPDLWTDLTGPDGSSDQNSDGGEGEEEEEEEEEATGGAGPSPARGSLEEALAPLAEFLILTLGAREGREGLPYPDKPEGAILLASLVRRLLGFLAQRLRRKKRRRGWRGTRHPTATPAQTPPEEEEGCPGGLPFPADLLTPEDLPSRLTPVPTPAGASPGEPEWRRLLDGTAWSSQIQDPKRQEEERGQLPMGGAVTDSEKRIENLTAENEGLKHNLRLTQELLWQLGGPESGPRPAHLPLLQEDAAPCAEAGWRARSVPEQEERLGRLEEWLALLGGRQEEAARRLELGLQRLQDQLEAQGRRASPTQDRELQGLRDQLACLERRLEASERSGDGGQLAELRGRLAALPPALHGLRRGCLDLRSLLRDFAQSSREVLSQARGRMGIRALEEQHQVEPRLRRDLQGPRLELKGNIRVLCRLKPGTPGDAMNVEPGPGGTITAQHRGRQRRFCLDRVFPPQATQEEVFLELEPTVLSCLSGYSVCIFAYGQTGSGKTYTMEGPSEDPGIGPRALRALFRELGAEGGPARPRVRVSMVEIYNEVIRDLLAREPQEKLVVRQRPDGSGQLHVPGLTSLDVPNLEELHKMLALGRSHRATAATHMNEQSSRSHSLLTLTFTAARPPHGSGASGLLHLVDLAGSERVWKSGAQGTRLREARNINRSLLALGEVMAALRAHRPHVPFRDSQLTRLLQGTLGRGCRTLMLVQISTDPEDLGETVCSLKFAERVGQVELGPAVKHRSPPSPETPPTRTPSTPETPPTQTPSTPPTPETPLWPLPP